MKHYMQDGGISTMIASAFGISSGMITDILGVLILGLITGVVVPFIRYSGDKLIKWLKSRGLSQQSAESFVKVLKEQAIVKLEAKIKEAKKKNDNELLDILEQELERIKRSE